MKLKNSKLFWGSIPQTPPPLVSLLQAAESWAGPGYEATRKRSVPTLCPDIGRVLATPLVAIRWGQANEVENAEVNF